MGNRENEGDYLPVGSYLPRAFTIKLMHPAIRTPAKSGPLLIPKAAFPTFMHEFAHLVQDWSTFRGIIDFLNLWDRVASIADHARRSGQEVPFPMVQAGGKLHRLTAETKYAIELDRLSVMTEPRRKWTGDKRSWLFERYEVGVFGLPLFGRKVEGRFVLVHLAEETTGEKYSHRLGAWEIKEAYSVAVGMIHGGKPKRPGKVGFEYLVVSRILDHYFDHVSPLHIIAFCHWALQDLAPANTLFALVEKLAQNGRKLPDADAVYEVGRDEALSRGFEENCRELVDQLQTMANEYAKAGNQSVGTLFQWYHDHAGRLLLAHLNRARKFPLDGFLCQDSSGIAEEECSKKLEKLFREVHVPLLIWPDGSTYNINADADTEALVFFNRCVVDLLSRVWRGTTAAWECPIYSACDLQLKDHRDCQKQPWKKGWEHPTCPYGGAAKVFGIEPNTGFQHVPFSGKVTQWPLFVWWTLIALIAFAASVIIVLTVAM